ncbi:hypothetical protein AAVH_08255 [Aphelenchoides avenae]|nr:hypothetical protein AAVH_08255 [Aphelenchus avenae]
MYAFYVLPVVFLLAPHGVLSDVGPPVEDCENKAGQLIDILCGICKKLCDQFSLIPRDALIKCSCHPDMTTPDCVKVKNAVDILQKGDTAAIAEAMKECGQQG